VWGQVDLGSDGEVKATLVVSLDYFPVSRPNKATLPRCLNPLPDDFKVGRAVCVQGQGEVDIVARNTIQECFAGTDRIRKSAEAILTLSGCARANIVGYKFDPEVRIHVEGRM
jgi:hypothetical protein